MLRKFLFAVIVGSFIFTANCQAQETSETESAPIVEESGSFFSSAKNFFGNLFSSGKEEDYELFSHDDDRETIERSKQAFEKIYAALWIDSEDMNIGGERFLKDYYATTAKEKVPQQLFPYNLESSWRPAPDEKIRKMKSDKSVKKARKRIYNMLKGEWTNLNDGTPETINLSSENDDKPQEPPFEYPRMGDINFLDEEEPFVSFKYDLAEKKSRIFFITPAVYIDDNGNRENVLVLYEGYELLKHDPSYRRILEYYCVENIKKAERVLIKPLQ